jgi:hypothetical protein
MAAPSWDSGCVLDFTVVESVFRKKTRFCCHWWIDKRDSVTRMRVRPDVPAATELFTNRHQP